MRPSEPAPSDEDSPGAVEIFGALSSVQLTARAPLNRLLEDVGLRRLTSTSPAEDLRDALETLKAGIVAARLDVIDRATLGKLVLDTLAEQKITNARGMVKAVLGELTTPTTAKPDTNSNTIILSDDEPASEEVDGAALLDSTAALVRRHIVLSPVQADAIALWVAATYLIDILSVMPILLVTAPTMRSGKTTLLLLLAALVRRALAASNVTGAVVVRTINRHQPTLLLDEVDTWFMSDDGDMRGLLDAGEYRETAYVLRCAPETLEPERIACFGARVLAMIGRPTGKAATVADRSLIIELRRKRADETVERMRLDRLREDHRGIRRQWRRWANDHREEIRESAATLPEAAIPGMLTNDRARSHWRPLLAVADLVGADWPARARAAAVELSGERDESINVELLRDVRDVFVDRDAELIASTDLAAALAAMTDRPWAAWGKQERPITPAKLARLLAGFGVVSQVQRIGDKTPRAYRRAAFEDAWARYVPAKCNSATSPIKTGLNQAVCEVQHNGDVADRKQAIGPMNTDECCTVAASEPDPGAGNSLSTENRWLDL